MEAVPRMPMIALELKHSLEYVDFGPTLKQRSNQVIEKFSNITKLVLKYIRDHYSEDPAVYNKACNELEQLRQSAIHVSHDFMGCSTLKKYFAQLQFLQGRFPMTEGGEAAIPFTWEDVHSGREVTLEDIKFEQACVLYNIGSLHSVLGAMDTRQSADGMKVSCTHFQCASWAYEYLRDHFGCAAMSLDMSHEVLTFQVSLMLAQAQECILEKSMTDSRKSTITAKVAAQIVEFYKTTLKNLDTCHSEELISSRRYKDWKKRIDMKVLFYTCITHYYMGRQSEDQQKWGQCLAYYTLAQEKLNECTKLAKGESQDIQESLRFTNDVVGGKYQAAKKDNDFVYHEKVPAADSLPEVKGASLVKGIPFNPNDPEISGPDIFQKLVPMSAHEASSLYSEEKASLLRRTVSEITEKNEELQKYMDSLQLDQSKLNPEQERLPQQLLEKCAALSVRPNAIKDLVDSMGAVSNVATDVDLGLKEIQQMLEEEAKQEEEFQNMFGKRATNVVLGEITKECQMFEEGHKKGSQSNNDLHKAMNTHISNLKLLSSPLEELQKLLPSLDKAQEPENADIINELNMLLSKIEEMKTQRASFEDQLRKDIQEDDITNVLVTREGVNREILFSEQLKKHEKTTGLIKQNLAAQANILRALTDANAKYASVRRTMSETIAKRDQTVRDLINSYDVYEDLMAKSQKGLEFYKKLETNVRRLLARCMGVCKVQQEEREQITNRYKPKAPPPSRPAAPKPSPSDPTVSAPAVSAASQPHPTVPPMFEGPKLKDYLPFMKPKTFGKKDGDSVPDIPLDPAVAAYISRTGSLPSSGTASPVRIPGSGSLPASPDHLRLGKDGPDRLRQTSLGPQIQYPDIKGHMEQGQGPSDISLSQRLPQGHFGPGGLSAPASQGQISRDQLSDGPTGPKMRRNIADVPPSKTYPSSSMSSTGGQNMGQQFQPQGHIQGQGQPSAQTGSDDQYVPLNQKWKQEGQGYQMPPASPVGPVAPSLRDGARGATGLGGYQPVIPRSTAYDPQLPDRQKPASFADVRPTSSPAQSIGPAQGPQTQTFYSQPGGVQGHQVFSQHGVVNSQSAGSQMSSGSSQPQLPQGIPQQPPVQGSGGQTQLQPALSQHAQIRTQQFQPSPQQQPQMLPTSVSQQYSHQVQPASQPQQHQVQPVSQPQQQFQPPYQTIHPQHIQPVSQQQPSQIPTQQVLPTSQQLPQQQQPAFQQQQPVPSPQMIQPQQHITAQQQQMVSQMLPPVSQQQQGIPAQQGIPQAQQGMPQQPGIPQQQGITHQGQIPQQGIPQQQQGIPQGIPQQQQGIPQPQQGIPHQQVIPQQQGIPQQQQGLQQHQQNIPQHQHGIQQQPQMMQQNMPAITGIPQQPGIPQQTLPAAQSVTPQQQQMIPQHVQPAVKHQQTFQPQPGMQQYIQPGPQPQLQTFPQQVQPVSQQQQQGSPQHQQSILPQQQQQQFPQNLQPVSHQQHGPQFAAQVSASGSINYGPGQPTPRMRPDIISQGNIPQQQVTEKGITNTVETVRTPVISPGDKGVSIAHIHTPQDHSQNQPGVLSGGNLPHQQVQGQVVNQGQMTFQGQMPSQTQLPGQSQLPGPSQPPTQGQMPGQSSVPINQAQGQLQMAQVAQQGQSQFSQGHFQGQTVGQGSVSGVQFQPQGQVLQTTVQIQGQITQQPRMIQPHQVPQPQHGYQQIPQAGLQSQPSQQQTGSSEQYQAPGLQIPSNSVQNVQNQNYSPGSQFQTGISQQPSSLNQQPVHQQSVKAGSQNQWQGQENIQSQGQFHGQISNQGPVTQGQSHIPGPSQGQTQGQIPTQYPSLQVHGQIPIPNQPQVPLQNQAQFQNQQPRSPAPPYSETGLNRLHTQQVLSQSQISGQTNLQNRQQAVQHGQTQVPLPGNQQQYGQSQQVQGQGQQMYSQQMGTPGYNQGIQNQQPVQQIQPQGQFNQMEQAQLPSPIQPQPVKPAPMKGEGQDGSNQMQGQGQGQQPQPVQPQTQSKQETETSYVDPNSHLGSQQSQNVPKWTPLNLNAPQEPAASGRVVYPGQGKTGSGPTTPPVKADSYKSPLSSVKSTPTHSRENSQGKLPDSSAVTEPLPAMRQLSTASSLDEILSSSPDGRSDGQTDNVLAPKAGSWSDDSLEVLTAQEIQQQKEDLMKNSSLKHQPLDPYKDKTKLDKFVVEVEKLAKFIEGFEKPTCSGPTPLDLVWKELMEEQDKAVRAQSLAIARCYPMKNREQDIMPYDNSRVLLTSLSDDYINASWVNDLSPSCPKFIATQSPLPVTLIDFWCMMYEQGVEVLVTLSSENEVGKKFPVYWPEEKGKTVHHGSVHLTLQSKKEKPFWTERILHLTHSETRSGRTLVHLHYNAWPVSGFPDKVSHILQFITEVHSFYRQQRSLMKPVLVHCSNGIGRSGMFILIYVGMQNINYGNGIINLPAVGGKMLWKRRNLLLRKDQLKYCYEAVLYYAQDILAKQGILVHKASFGDRLPAPGEKAHSWEPTEDILFGSMSLSSLQSNVEKFGIKSNTADKQGVKHDTGEKTGGKSDISCGNSESDIPNKLDEKLQKLKEETKGIDNGNILDEELVALDTDLPKPSDSFNLTNLPDVVQRPSDSLEHKINKAMEELNSEKMSIDILGEFGSPKKSVLVKDSEKKGSVSSLTSLGSDHSGSGAVFATEKMKSLSLSGSPLHQSRESSESPGAGKQTKLVSSSLSDLQDPNTFTIGTSPKGKRKITKADFLSGETTLNKEEDSSDPLSTLDPLWSLK